MVEYRLDRMGKARVSDSQASPNAEIDHHVYDEDKYEYFAGSAARKSLLVSK